MVNLEFETTGEWSLQGSDKKKLYLSFVAKIEGWKKNIIFYKSELEEEVWNFLLQMTEGEPRTGWIFSVITRGRYMNSIFVNRVLWVKNDKGKIVFEE